MSFRSEDNLAGLPPGRYEFVVMPDDVVFDPPAIDVGPQSLVHEVSWAAR